MWQTLAFAKKVKSTRKAFVIGFLASIAPAAVYSVFDPGFSIFVAPFIYLFTCFCSLVLWFLLKLCKCPERFRDIIVVLSLVLFSVYIGISVHHTYTAAGRFERLLTDPIPKSVRFIDSEGQVGMAGGYEIIVFSISPFDLDNLLQAQNFKPYDLQLDDNPLDKQAVLRARSYKIDPDFTYKSGEESGEGSFLMLLANKSKDKVFLYRCRM